MASNIKPKTISFKDGRDVDRIDELFKPGTRLYNRAPDAIKGNRSKMALWSIEALTQLYDGGVDNLQAELFEPDSQQMAVVTEENKRLKAEVLELRTALADIQGKVERLAELEAEIKELRQSDPEPHSLPEDWEPDIDAAMMATVMGSPIPRQSYIKRIKVTTSD